MNIYDIKNPWLRRPLLILTVFGIVVCLGPLHLIVEAWRWLENEYDIDVRAAWRGQ